MACMVIRKFSWEYGAKEVALEELVAEEVNWLPKNWLPKAAPIGSRRFWVWSWLRTFGDLNIRVTWSTTSYQRGEMLLDKFILEQILNIFNVFNDVGEEVEA
jgi:hypothetical protein